MKRLLTAALICFLSVSNVAYAQTGKYAGSKKSLIGKEYTRDMAGLKGWESLGGSVISNMDDPETITADIFRKGTTQIILFCIKEDTATDIFIIADVVEVKAVTSKQEIKTGLCRKNKTESAMTVALIQPRNQQYNKALKAWIFNRDKRRVEIIPAAKVDCLHEGWEG